MESFAASAKAAAPLFIGLGTVGSLLVNQLEAALAPEERARPHQVLAVPRPTNDPRPPHVSYLVRQALEAVEGSRAEPVALLAILGGRTGGAACVAVAQALQAQGRATVVGVLLPFGFEGRVRMQGAQAQLQALQATGAALCVVSNEERLAERGGLALVAVVKERERELVLQVARQAWDPERGGLSS